MIDSVEQPWPDDEARLPGWLLVGDVRVYDLAEERGAGTALPAGSPEANSARAPAAIPLPLQSDEGGRAAKPGRPCRNPPGRRCPALCARLLFRWHWSTAA